MDVAAIKGFEPSDPAFHQRFHRIPLRPSLFSFVVTEGRSTISDDVLHDPNRVGQPPGHPPVHTYLGVPLRVADKIIGMIGVANKKPRYTPEDERLLTTFANQAAVAIENARLYDEQREMIARLEKQDRDLRRAERERVQHEDRERIAADLHDRIEQAIFSMGLTLNGLLDRDELSQATREGIHDVRRLAARTAEEMREVIFALSTTRSGSGGLAASVRRLLKEAGRRHGLETDLVLTGSAAKLDAHLQEVLLSVTREALINIARHANAQTVLVGLNNSSDHVELVIQDDGRGAPEMLLEHITESATHFGLKSMKRQVESVGGSLTLVNGDDGGFAIKVRVPA
jgi:signal transduction histidine kinase